MSDWVFRRPHDYRAKPSNLFALLAIASATSGAAAITITPTGTLAGDGALAGTCSLAFDGQAAPQGSNLSGTAAITITPTATPIALGQVTGTAAMVLDGSGTLTGDVAYNLALRYKPTKLWPRQQWYSAQLDRLIIFPYSQITGIAGQADIAITPTGTLRGTGIYAGVSSTALGATGTLTGVGALATSTPITITPTGDLTSGASGAVTGTAAMVLDGSASLRGAGALAGVSAAVLSAQAVPVGTVQYSGTVTVTLTAAATLTGDFTTPRVVATMTIEPTQRGITIEPVVHGDSARA